MEKEKLINCCISGEMTAQAVAWKMDLSVRQVERLKAKVRKGTSLIHGNCGRKPAITISKSKEAQIIREYAKYNEKSLNFAHFQEILEEDCHIKISYTALTKLLGRNGIQSPKKHRKRKKKQHRTRERKEFFGELLQMDGTPFDWFGDGILRCLHVIIDDCTGIVTGLYMCKNECMSGYFEILRQTFENYGLPKNIYADGLSMIWGTGKKEPTIEEQLVGKQQSETQFMKMLRSLKINPIHAHSPQAKGRVERKNGTFQGRLVAELARYGVKNMEQANEFFKWWLPKHNEKFGVNADSEWVFRYLSEDVDLNYVLSYKIAKKADNGGCFSLNGYTFQALGLNGLKFELLISKNFGLKGYFQGKYYDILPISTKGKIAPNDSVKAIIDKFVALYTLKNEHAFSA